MLGGGRLLVLAVSFVLVTGISFSSCAFDNVVKDKLAEIQQLQDTQQALQAVDGLLRSGSYSLAEKVEILNIQAKLYFRQRNFDQALDTVSSVLMIAEEKSWPDVAAVAYKMQGIFHYYQGNFPKALTSYQQALQRYQPLEKKVEQANLYNNIGLVYAAMGQTLKALDSYQLAEVIYKQHGTDVDLVDIRYNIAGLYLRLRRYDLAIEMFNQVQAKRKLFNDQEGLASVRSDLGVTYKHSGDFPRAIEHLLLALNYYRQTQDNYHLASSYHNLAEVYNELHQVDEAQHYAQLALNISEQYKFNAITAGSLQSLAQALFVQGQTEKPLALLHRSSEIAQALDYQQQLRANLSLLPMVYSATGNRVAALKSYQEFIALNHKLSNDQLNEYLAKFESAELKQQVAQLQQSKKLKQLEIAQANQKQNLAIGAVILVLLILFLNYRRQVDRRLKSELAVQVKQRTIELEKLTEQLKQANSIKSQFLANMSHEIRTPLTAIIGQAEAIISGDVDQQYLEKEVEIIHGNSLYLLELINNILDLSKIEANKLELELQMEDLHQILTELANMFTEQAYSKGLEFKITHHLSSPFIVEIDGLRVKQVLINLCSNAIKFTPRGSVNINVSVQKNELIFKVTDTGIGLSYTQIQQVFESFTQGDSSISRRFGGSGLGLCLSEQLARLMNGRIEIDSQLNQGSTFSLIIPFEHSLEQGQVAKAQTVLSKVERPAEQTYFNGTVLLADDHDDNRRLIARFLKTLGLDVIGACNGQEVIDLYADHKPQLILLDIQMPEMDGIEAFTILRQQGCSVPIIALTANAMSHEVAHYIELGFTAHLKKPIERKAFINTIAQYLHCDVSVEDANQSLEQVDMSDLVQQFKSNLALEQQDIVAHLNADNYDLLKELVHRIAGAAQMFGFSMLSRRALDLEIAVKSERYSDVNDLTQLLLNEIDQVLW
ncbi:hypothetical protein tinsulaeT_06350 [Thalassotalea insulae]|uniref:histidine kinase n=1 Tax=Thalassotalea insulae TaxID=2056778 RepID=A0ABQ6GMS4_9GAMM|nr:tetratricopeptide repeat protein [Thalassotalea insulae]GLX77295.1 hypothetical protein tinsulaeT_06350 [Thalassotalea insulae]